MEDYNEKLIWCLKSGDPYEVERLIISVGQYGYNLIDRKNKVQLLFEKSKETCEEGKNLLLASKFDLYEIFKERVKDEEITKNKILIDKGKHGDHFFSIPTLKDLYKVSLYLLKERINYGYIQDWGKYNEKPLDYTEEDIEKLPLSFQEKAKEKLNYYNEQLKAYEENKIVCDLAKKAIKEKDGATAFRIINNRRDYEYESFEIIEPTKL
jgi:hypothetical protein